MTDEELAAIARGIAGHVLDDTETAHEAVILLDAMLRGAGMALSALPFARNPWEPDRTAAIERIITIMGDAARAAISGPIMDRLKDERLAELLVSARTRGGMH